jgi:hypothetical protein
VPLATNRSIGASFKERGADAVVGFHNLTYRLKSKTDVKDIYGMSYAAFHEAFFTNVSKKGKTVGESVKKAEKASFDYITAYLKKIGKRMTEKQWKEALPHPEVWGEDTLLYPVGYGK